MNELMKRYEAETDEVATWTWHNKEFVTDDVLDWAWKKIQTLESENEKLREDASEVFIKEMSMKNGSFDVTFESGIGPVIAVYIAKMLDSHHAENFVTTLISSTRGLDGEKYYMTMGRCNGKKVEEKYHEVMSENSQLKDQLRWRPVSEKPEKQTGQILCKRQVKVNSKEFTRLYPADMCDIEDWAHFVKKLEIVSYLPIPPAPEGE